MSRPKLEVNDVWILEEIVPYESSDIIGVFYDPEVAKGARPDVKRWYQDVSTPDRWVSRQSSSPSQEFSAFYLISKHPIRTK